MRFSDRPGADVRSGRASPGDHPATAPILRGGVEADDKSVLGDRRDSPPENVVVPAAVLRAALKAIDKDAQPYVADALRATLATAINQSSGKPE